jgi:branched-chain amino acid transport system permease protein
MRRLLPIALVVLAGVVLTLVLQERYHHRVLTLVLVWATMGLAWNIISGYAGQTSFGHQAFFGIGAYVTVLLAVTAGLTPWLGMVVGMAAAVVAAVLIGLPTFRLAGIYFALATLAYPLIFRIVMDFLGYRRSRSRWCATARSRTCSSATRAPTTSWPWPRWRPRFCSPTGSRARGSATRCAR